MPGMDEPDAALLSAVLARSPQGIAFIGADLTFGRVNPVLARLSGVSPAEHIGRSPAEVWPPELAARVSAAVRQVISGRQPQFEADWPVTIAAAAAPEPGPDGEAAGQRPAAAGPRRWALSCYPVPDPDGDVAGVLLLAEDITDQQARGEAVRRSDERYRSLVKAGAQVVWVTTPLGEIAEDAPEWRWITGQSEEAYRDGGWLAAVHPEDAERVSRDWQDCIAARKNFDCRYRVRTRTGSYRHYDVRAVPIERDGQVVEWIGACTDVTAQREAEEMRGRLTEQLSAAALRTARLQQATSMLAEALSVDKVVEVITEVGRSAIGAERSAVAMLNSERQRLRTINATGLPDEFGSATTGEIPLDTPSVMTAAITARRPVLLESQDALRRYFEAEVDPTMFLTNTDEQAWVGLPLLSSGQALGALRFSFTRPRTITEEERVFLEALAGQCAMALERASLFEREHNTAETLQRSLLPDTLPKVPGIVLGAKYLPVTRNMEIGGDWYDAFQLPDGKLAVAAGDVMGKGLTAAAGMGRVRNALRALALTDPRPAAVLAGLDRLFIATEAEEQVTTVAYLVVDPETGEGMAGNAGHLPPLLLSDGAPPRLDETEAGTPLGWASPRRQYAFALPPGNTAVLYSDGLVENRRRGLDAGLDELVAVAAQAPAGVLEDPERLLGYLVDRMLAGHEQDDDVTVLVVHIPARDADRRGPRVASVRKG